MRIKVSSFETPWRNPSDTTPAAPITSCQFEPTLPDSNRLDIRRPDSAPLIFRFKRARLRGRPPSTAAPCWTSGFDGAGSHGHDFRQHVAGDRGECAGRRARGSAAAAVARPLAHRGGDRQLPRRGPGPRLRRTRAAARGCSRCTPPVRNCWSRPAGCRRARRGRLRRRSSRRGAASRSCTSRRPPAPRSRIISAGPCQAHPDPDTNGRHARAPVLADLHRPGDAAGPCRAISTCRRRVAPGPTGSC